MTAIFISHRSSDAAEAQELKHWLGQQGHQQLFLDFDPADGIPAGVDWQQRLYQELRRCQALLIVLTPAWLESKWRGNELAIAREKGKAVWVVRVKPCPGLAAELGASPHRRAAGRLRRHPAKGSWGQWITTAPVL